MCEKDRAAYDLAAVRAKVQAGRYVLPMRVRRYISSKSWTEDAVHACVAALAPGNHHKTVPHRERPGVWLDIYRPEILGVRMYVKLTVLENGVDVLILSLCVDGEPH